MATDKSPKIVGESFLARSVQGAQQQLTHYPHHSHATPPLPLFELLNIPSRLVLDKIYLNGLHSLRRFEIRNVSSHKILVKLRSNLGSQVAFQLTNENFPDFDSEKLINHESDGLSHPNWEFSPATQRHDADNSPSDTQIGSLMPRDDIIAAKTRKAISSLSPLKNNPLSNIVTNTVAAAAAGSFGDNINGHQFNQLFNYVNHIDEVEILPWQSQKVILAFLPDPRDKARRSLVGHSMSPYSSDTSGISSSASGNIGSSNSLEETNENSAVFSISSEEDEIHDFFEVNGLLFFFGYNLDREQDSKIFLKNTMEDNRGEILGRSKEQNLFVQDQKKNLSPSPAGSNSTLSSLSIISDNQLSDQAVSSHSVLNKISKSEGDGTSGGIYKADYQLTLKFRATVCRSVLWTDVGEIGINFDDCVAGGTYFKDFTIWNRSEIELYWLLNTVDLSNTECQDSLRFTDYDTGELIDTKPIPSYSHRRIRVTFRPKETGEFNYDLQLENANDPSNVVESRIHALVRSVLSEESLVVSSGNILDFGDCCAGCWSKQQLVLKNVGESPLEVHFASENAEILFHLNTEESIMYPSKTINGIGKRFAEENLEDDLFHSRLKDNPNTNATTIDTNTTSEKSIPSSITSSRAPSPAPQMRDIDMMNSPTELPNLTSQTPSQSTSRSASRHRLNVHEDSDFEGPLTGYNSDVFTPRGDIFQKGDIYLENEPGVTQIEEVSLRPGQERTVNVFYRPEKDASVSDFNAGHLTRRSFRIILQYASVKSQVTTFLTGNSEKKIIQCKARSCTSFVKVDPKEVNFGDTDVGTLKSMPITITNLSELTAHVELQFISKVLSCNREEITIPPKQLAIVKLDMYPRKVNVDYRKQITVVNLQNRDNDQIIEVRSTNIDKNRVTFHSLFYRILTTSVSHYLNFGSTILNSPRVRTFTIDNISKKNLVLELTSSLPEEIILYQKLPNFGDTGHPNESFFDDTTEGSRIASETERREKLLESISDRRPIKKHVVPTEGSIGSNMVNSTLLNPIILTGDAPNLGNIKRPNATNPPEMLITEISSTNTAYLDLASSSIKEARRPPRKRPLKLALGKNVGSAIERIKESENLFGGGPGKSNPNSSLGISSGNELVVTSKNVSSNKDSQSTDVPKKQSTSRIIEVDKNISLSNNFTSKNQKEKINQPIDFTRMSLKSLIVALEVNNVTAPPLFPNAAVEEAYVRNQMGIVRELHNRIRDQKLLPVKTVEILPGAERQIIVVFTPNPLRASIQGIPKKQDARIFLRLIEFDRDIQQPQFEGLIHSDQSQIPVRELLVRSTLCRSIMELGQKNINFGAMDKNKSRNKTIVIQNRSEVPLLYSIKKSGSIASGDIVLGDGRMGLIRGYGKKEVEFTFDPSLPGQFQEKLVIENIQDRYNDQVISVKANIRKQSTFLIQSPNLHFGPCLINENSGRVQHFIISNTDKQTRTFEVRVEGKDLRFNGCIGELKFSIQEDAEGGPQISGLVSQEMEEEIENLEQKVKIARRKGREDKVKKIEKKIARLRRGETGREDEDEDHEPNAKSESKDDKSESLSDGRQTPSEDSFVIANVAEVGSDTTSVTTKSISRPEKGLEPQNKRSTPNSKDVPKFKRLLNSIIFPLEARTTKTVSVHFRAISNSRSSPAEYESLPENINGRVFIHEHKNNDSIKTIMFWAIVCYDYSSYLQAQLADDASQPITPHESLSGYSEPQTRDRNSSPSLSRRLLDSFAPPPLTHFFDALSTIFPETSAINYLPSYGLTRVASPEQTTIESLVDSLVLEPSILDIGRLEVNHEHIYYFKLSNRADSDLDYEIVVDKNESGFFKFEQTRGTLSPQQTRRIDFTAFATNVGRQVHSLVVRDLMSKAYCTFVLYGYVHYPQYLRFPALGHDGQSDLDLGYCYVDPGRKYSQVTPLLVENITDQDLYITCQSNLSLQVIIFLDEYGERGQVVETLLNKKKKMTVWVALQPNLLGGILGSGRRGAINQDINNSPSLSGGIVNAETNSNLNAECRILIGGIKFSIQVKEKCPLLLTKLLKTSRQGTFSEEELVTASTQTVKFTSLIGQSVLSISDKIITLGSTSRLEGAFYGSFTLKNLSSHLPLDYLVESSGNNLILDRSRGTLEGWDKRSASIEDGEFLDEIEPEANSQAIIAFRAIPSSFGLLSQKIIVTNLHHTEQVFEVEVRLFVDAGTIKFLKRDNSPQELMPKDIDNHESMAIENPKEIESFPSVHWNNIYVTIISDESNRNGASQPADFEVIPHLKAKIQKGYQSDTAPLYEQCVEVGNKSANESLHIIPKSDLNISVRWGLFGDSKIIEDENIEFHGSIDSPFQRCGPQCELKPGDRAFLYIACPEPIFLDKENSLKLVKGKKAIIEGVLLLYDLKSRTTVKMIDLKANYCVSKGELTPAEIELGKIGHANSWSEVQFQFTLRNISGIPLQYELQSPDCIEIRGIVDEGSHQLDQEVISLKRVIDSYVEQKITAALKPRRIEDFQLGERIFEINVLNMFNPENKMTINLKATLTLFEMVFERLVHGELVLPPLCHPITRHELPSDSWFSILNSGDDDIRFEIGAELSPDISQFVKIEVLSRFSNSPLVGGVTINAHGSIEVRVRAHPNESLRLPSDSSYFINPDGITFGKLWIATKQSNGEDEDSEQITKTIPIRGVITECSTFTISNHHIIFKTTLYGSDNESNGFEDEANGIVQTRKRRANSQNSNKVTQNIKFLEEWLNQSETININNLCSKIPLRFKVSIEAPIEIFVQEILNITPLDDNGCGIIEAGQQFTLNIELLDPSVPVLDDIKIHIDDMESLSGQRNTILISTESETHEHRVIGNKVQCNKEVLESIDQDDSPRIFQPLEPSSEQAVIYQKPAKELPFISLRGCKRIGEPTEIGGRYELDLGQQDLGSSTVVKKLTLENSTVEQISYRIKTVSSNDQYWLKISPTEGTLDPSVTGHNRQHSDGHTIALSFSANFRRVFSTYLIVENLNNPADTKTIRVVMEVVARQNLRRGASASVQNNHVFDIYVNGVDTSQTCIEMLNLFYGSEYSARSMVVYNRETVPLEFTFQTSIDYEDPSEIVFSTSRMSAKLFKTLTVEPESNVRVYIRLLPLPHAEIQGSLDRGEYRDPNEVEKKIIEIYVNCRLVKDYQQTVILKAECRIPSLRVVYNEFEALKGKISRSESNSNDEEWVIKFESDYKEIRVNNLLGIPLEYEIVNDTMYFLLELPDNTKNILPFSHHNIKVRPNIKALMKNAENVRREKYIQENITVYNRRRPSENYWIPLRISFGYISNFQLASGYRSSYAFGMLENHTVRFLSDFNSNTHLFDIFPNLNDEEIKGKMIDLEFHYFYIVDQLVYYATIKTGENWFQLASLLFGTVLGSNIFQKYAPSYLKKPDFLIENAKIWPSVLVKWVSPLNYFISFFPYHNTMLESLKDLHKSLIISPPNSGTNY
ncbi:hypothetical protein G9A89_001471 [Geosiphon pyriformis]|nr:hypothetical protein G9A89_001471 [Geosiphon pyriformis]